MRSPVVQLGGHMAMADERDDQIDDPANDAQAESETITAQQTPAADVERLHELLVHIRGVQLDLRPDLTKCAEETAEVADVGHALGDDDRVAIVQFEHQDEL